MSRRVTELCEVGRQKPNGKFPTTMGAVSKRIGGARKSVGAVLKWKGGVVAVMGANPNPVSLFHKSSSAP